MADSNRKAQLSLIVKEIGAKEAAAEIEKLSTTTLSVQKELGKIARIDQIQKIGGEMGNLAKKTRDVGKAVEELSKKLTALGASKDEIRAATDAFSAAQTGGGRNVLARAGSELRALPSTQTGLGFGTDAVGNVLRLSGALTEVAGKSALTTLSIKALTPWIGAQTAATYAAVVPITLFVAGFIAIAVALDNLTQSTSKNVDQINTYADSQRNLSDEIVGGLTSEAAKKDLEALNERRTREAATLAKLQSAYDAADKALLETGTVVRSVARAFSGDEQALADQIKKSQEVFGSTEGEIAALTTALEDGSLAANDAAEAEKRLTEERSKAALASADTAAKELQSQQKALNATEDQNKKRLETIEEEKAVIEKQIEVLNASGVTSEEVTAKLAALNGQLGSLGKESEFIKNTALEVSRQADAEKKAKKDAEDAAKKAEQAQEQYTKAVDSATRTYKQSVEDIGTRLRQTLADNTLKLNRDLTDIATKYRRDEYDLTIKANRAERDALQDQLDDLDDMRRDALKDEQQAIQEGDFKALFLARQKGAETVQQEAAEIERDRQKRQQNAEDARADLLRAAERQRSDRVMGYDRQNMDARTAQQRELQQAVTTRQRALQVATEGLNAELKQLGNYYAARLKMDQQYQNNSLKIASGGGSQGANANSPFGAMQSTFRAMGGVIRK